MGYLQVCTKLCTHAYIHIHMQIVEAYFTTI